MNKPFPARCPCTIAICALFATGACNGPNDHPEIRSVLDKQVAAWNAGDVEGFMAGYWKSDELTFSTPEATTHGWQATFTRFKKKYATREQMGSLRFRELAVAQTSPTEAEVSGRFEMIIEKQRRSGRFYLTFRLIDGKWVIVRDHTVGD
jgi:beta-aspartyl-peptidase (threonine type)